MYLQKAPVIRVLFPFSAGLLTGQLHGTGEVLPLLLPVLSGCWILLLVLYAAGRWVHHPPRPLFAMAAFLLIAAAGYGTGMQAVPADPGLPAGERVIVEGLVMESPATGSRYQVFEMNLRRICTTRAAFGVRTPVRVYMEMPADSVLPADGEIWRMCGRLSAIRNSGNPGEIDYAGVMQRSGIFYSFFAEPDEGVNHAIGGPAGILYPAARLRQSLSGRWNGEPEAVSLLKAVCLGDRSGISDDQRESFADAGGMHLLAVSGLHVGLIWWFLNHLLAWMTRLLRRELYRSLTIILLLWVYACVAGFSSSVSRSVVMFTFISISRLAGRRSGTVNGVLVSAFFLLLVKPRWILDVGFQLSYAAVLGIVTIFPAIRGICRPRSRILTRIRDAILVSLAAQVTTAPLAAFYFHKLPVYGILTNLVAIPMLSGLIFLFLASLPFISAGIMPGMFNRLLTGVARLMNRYMELAASLPGSTVEELYPGTAGVVVMMLLLVAGMAALNLRGNGPRYLVVLLLAILLIWSAREGYCRNVSAEFAISHYSGCSVVTFRQGEAVDHYIFCHDTASMERAERGIARSWDVRRHQIRKYLPERTEHLTGQVSALIPAGNGAFLVGNDRFRGWILTGGAGRVYGEIPREGGIDFILLSGEPEFRDPSFTTGGQDPVVILDGSSRSWYLRRMQESVQEAHVTGLDGAYLKRW